jgi:CMP-2-keto-3-deoxyoctulosonic acid synthetase
MLIRFPAKLMQDLGGKTVILRTYEAAGHICLMMFFVVTDSDLIFDEIVSNGGHQEYQRTRVGSELRKLFRI